MQCNNCTYWNETGTTCEMCGEFIQTETIDLSSWLKVRSLQHLTSKINPEVLRMNGKELSINVNTKTGVSRPNAISLAYEIGLQQGVGSLKHLIQSEIAKKEKVFEDRQLKNNQDNAFEVAQLKDKICHLNAKLSEMNILLEGKGGVDGEGKGGVDGEGKGGVEGESELSAAERRKLIADSWNRKFS